jgi:hypothetical protein
MSTWALVLLMPFFAACAFVAGFAALNWIRRWRFAHHVRMRLNAIAADCGMVRGPVESDQVLATRLRLTIGGPPYAGSQTYLEQRLSIEMGTPVKVTPGSAEGIIRVYAPGLTHAERLRLQALAEEMVPLGVQVSQDWSGE